MDTFSFQKGWFQVRQGEVAEVRSKIMAKIGITTRMGFLNRLNGDTIGTEADREAIERVFAEYGIKNIWGKV
jgi:hypothetical protein